MSARRTPARSRRVDDALSQLVDSLLPPISSSALGENYSADDEDALAVIEERRLQERVDRAWRILDVVGAEKERANSDGNGGSSAENINNASDLIKRKLLRENASPDKAVRFTNLYSRLLTQPVLGQKWAILYLLYKLSEQEGGGMNAVDDAITMEGDRSRSPLLDDGNLDNLLFKSRLATRALAEDIDEGPAISSSVSQRGEALDQRRSVPNVATENKRRTQPPTAEEARDSIKSNRTRATSTAKEAVASQEAIPSQTLKTDSTHVKTAESSLLRDLPFILQGLSSTNIEFSSSTMLKLPTNLPVPMISLLHTLAEPCLLYKELSAFVDSTEGGLVSQALRASIFNELRSYLSLVATLEGEIRRALTAAASDDPKGMVKGAVTLKRCVVWTRDATMALRLMSIMVEEARGKPLMVQLT